MEACDLFVRIPFVVNAIPGIDDNSYDHVAPAVKTAYVEALLREMESVAEDAASWNVRSITLGGGTVSSLSADDLRRLLQGMAKHLPCGSGTPLFATVDPGRLSTAHANELRAFGDTRLSLRYFTADLREGDAIGFPSSEAEMSKTDVLLDNLGLANVGMKIAVGIPGQTEATLLRTLRLANRSTVKRMELVALPPSKADEAADPQRAVELEQLFATARHWLEEHGYRRDTVRAFSRSEQDEGDDSPATAAGSPSPSNANPLVVNWYGAAAANPASPGACGRVSFGSGTLSAFDGLLWSNVGDVNRYIQGSPDPESITDQVAELDDAARSVQSLLDAAYRCLGPDASSPAYGLHFETDAAALIAANA